MEPKHTACITLGLTPAATADFVGMTTTRHLFLLLFSLLPATSANAVDVRPNVIVVLVDDLGWKDLACQGSDVYQTPHIDRLAA
ncbi:MAG: hypothetical protein ACKO4T_10890 [Planctomycetaceae bacterium]